MVNITKEELPIEETLRKKLELICEFAKTTPKIINGNIRKTDRTNLTYIEPNRTINFIVGMIKMINILMLLMICMKIKF